MLINKTILNGEFTFRNAEIQDVAQMEYVQSQCYPTLSEREIFKKHHFENHIKLFQQGQFIIENQEKIIVATTSTFLCHFPTHDHTFLEATDHLWLKGQITVGMTIGYGKFKNQLSIEAYCEKLKNDELTDPTVSAQKKAGFIWIRPIFNYLTDPEAGNASILMYYPLSDKHKFNFQNGNIHLISN